MRTMCGEANAQQNLSAEKNYWNKLHASTIHAEDVFGLQFITHKFLVCSSGQFYTAFVMTKQNAFYFSHNRFKLPVQTPWLPVSHIKNIKWLLPYMLYIILYFKYTILNLFLHYLNNNNTHQNKTMYHNTKLTLKGTDPL